MIFGEAHDQSWKDESLLAKIVIAYTIPVSFSIDASAFDSQLEMSGLRVDEV